MRLPRGDHSDHQSDSVPIAALASGSGPGAVAIIRISGKNCWPLVARCLKDSSSKPPKEKLMMLRSFVNPLNKGSPESIDELMAAWFQGPRSFTGEDTVELYCHGGPYIISEILKTLYDQGIRPATPGEFTKRALLNGKLDLTAAEGIKNLVEAQSKQQWIAGRQLYTGKLRDQIESLRSKLIEAMAWLEAMIDFPDEGDTQHVQLDHVKSRVERVHDQISTLIKTFQSGRIASEGLMVAFAGAPNAGKSTLLNTLLGQNRAIVSEEAGTTRDYLEERCLLEGRLVRLVDMAGIRDTDNLIEKAGVTLSKELIQKADVVVGLMASDSTETERSGIVEILSQRRDTPVLYVMTKSDKGKPPWANAMISISCKTGEGISEFQDQLLKIVDHHMGGISEHPFITSARQQSCLLQAEKAVQDFWQAFKINSGHELLAFELQAAARALGQVIGELSNEDILDKVFRDFCIGK